MIDAALSTRSKRKTWLAPGQALFNLSGFLLNQVLRDSRLTVICQSPDLRMSVGRGDEHYAIVIDHPEIIWEIVTNPDPGAGELFMAGKWQMAVGDIGGFITMMARNFQNLLGGNANFLLTFFLKKKLQSRVRDAATSKDDIAHHYDIGNDLYEAFLDEEMNYSCAFFTRPDMSLREAQLNKIRTSIARLDIKPGMKVLDIGCGWGELCRIVAKETGATATGITLSENQLKIAAEKAKGMERPPSYLLEDYRDHAAQHKGAYDRIISVGMFEHVGEENYRAYFKAVKEQLAPGGRALIHSIVNASRASEKLMNSPWLEKYIFPGGRIPDLPEMLEAAEAEGLKPACDPYLQPPSDYARTLRLWRGGFDKNYPRLDHTQYDERFRLMWTYYLAMCEAMFEGCGCQVGQVVFERTDP